METLKTIVIFIISLTITTSCGEIFDAINEYFELGIYSKSNLIVILGWIIFLGSFWYLRELTYYLERRANMFNTFIKHISVETTPKSGRVENVYFKLAKKDEQYFFNIAPTDRNLKKIIKMLDNVLLEKKSVMCYGYDYAVKHFYIGNDEIFNWH
ncbi:hypothetical protein BKK49_08015 [Rodentibacter rarus]|uniref:Uncharacterized protein n=1 Tax=Rodentibacter rarus TaxID=1908260 RepID=A0A1V3IFY0_9PAST|nr:hypothetical protein [Rodentibacter rarus]OOF39466.1 hypothetical protein BKK49_08015 [Rodentibacter rarus]OOF39816.1 hypothetical protein BKK50_10225 [Rodentibacter rarus]